MAFDGKEGKIISKTAGRQLVVNHQSSPAFAANNNIKGVLFGRDHLDKILAQSGCVGVRVYYGKEGTSSTDPSTLVIVGTNDEGNDMTEVVLDGGYPCPTHCSSTSTKL